MRKKTDTIIIKEDDTNTLNPVNMRLDHYLTHILNVNRSKVTTLIKDNNVLVNELLVKPGYKLKEGDLIEIYQESELEAELVGVDLNLDIIYEDDDLLVVNKPKGLVVHPAPSYKDTTLVHGLIYHTKNKLSSLNRDNLRPGIIHRIDKDTSGLLLVAKTDEADIFLTKQLKERKIVRKYTALVYGQFPHQQLKVNAPIERDKKNRLKKAVSSEGRSAVSYFKVLKYFPHDNLTLLECSLETGRTHQIRVHLSHLGYPIVGDLLYGGHIDKINGQFLVARYLKIIHPSTKEPMEFVIDLPSELNNLLNDLY